jgi:hypothetical protein
MSMPAPGGVNPIAQLAMQRMAPRGPGAGQQAQAMAQIAQAIRTIQRVMMNLPIGSDVYHSVHKAIGDLSKHFPQTEGPDDLQAQQTNMQDQQRAMAQRAMLQRVLQAQGGGPQPMPTSTPVPGA